MLKVISLLVFAFTPFLAVAQTGQYVLNDGEGCYVKEYVNKKFLDVPYDQFKDHQIQAKPHSQNKTFMIFKVNNRFYATLARCLTDTRIADIDEMDLNSLNDSGEPESQPKKVKKKESKDDDRKFYVELGVGSFSIADKNPVYPNYKELENGYTLGGQPITVNKIHKTDYDSKFLISLGAGRKITETIYGGLKLKYYQGEKKDKIDITSGGYSGTGTARFKDQLISFLVGGKKIFLEKSQIRPFIGLYAGPSFITTKPKDDDDDSEYDSLSISAQLDLGLEYFIKKNLSFTMTYSYEYLGKRKFKEVDRNKKKPQFNPEGFDLGGSFTSEQDYSNSSIIVGVKYYFDKLAN